MQREDGEWRIDDAPDVRVVPDTWFGQAYRRVSLLYLDPTASILVPEPVFVPRGDQLAQRARRRACSEDRSGVLDDVERSAIPSVSSSTSRCR